MIRVFAVAFSACMLHAAAAATPADYAYVFPIETAATSADPASSAWRVELTPEVYRWVQDAGLRDVEIFNAEQHPVPFARFAVEPVATAREQTTPLPALELPATAKTASSSDLRLVIDRDADGRLRRIDAGEATPPSSTTRDWLLDASGLDRAIDSLVLSWRDPTSGIVARFAIDASDDLQSFRSAGTATVLMLEQQGARLERRDIALGGVRAKYLRLRRLDDGVALIGLRAEARSVERGRAAPSRVWITADAKHGADDASVPAGITRFDYTLTAALPVDTARIELASDNALASITLLARASDATPWNRIAAITAFRLLQGGEPLRNGDVDVSNAPRLREFRIESTTTLAEAPRLTLGFRPDSLIFLAEGKGPYVLAAGSAQARHAEYPIEAALASLRSTLGKDWQPPLATLGTAQASGGDAALHAPPPPLPWRRWLLWAILVGGAALIAGLALSLLRGAKAGN
jgi:hypothetical protein